jgi:hypothetical protein
VGTTWVLLARPSFTALHLETESLSCAFGPGPFRVNGLLAESNAVIDKAAGRGRPVTQDISLTVKGDKVVCSINGSIVASYDRGTLVGSGKLKSTNGYYGLRFAHNTDVFVSELVMSTK